MLHDRRQMALLAREEGEEQRERRPPSPDPEKMFWPVAASTIDWWMCRAEPGSSAIGLAMKVA